MKKRKLNLIISIVLCLIITITILQPVVFAQTEYTYNSLTYTISNDTITITGCDKSVMSVNIPPQIDGLDVTIIGNNAFYECSSMESIIIPSGVSSIGGSAFEFCENLVNVTIPDSVTSIGGCAFLGCYNLTDIYIKDIEKWCNIYIADNAASPFYHGSKLYLNNALVEELEIPNTIREIKSFTFEGCQSLTSVTIPNSVISIGDFAFDTCENLVNVTIPDSVKTIGESAFYNCISLTNLTIPESVSSIDALAFYGCDSLTSIAIPDGITSIGEAVFMNCNGLTSVTMPNSVTSIGDSLFCGCESLTSITIPDSVKNIGEGAFKYCESLTSVTIGENITSIGESAFFRCDKLEDLYYGGSEDDWNNISIGSNNECLTNATIHYNYESESDDGEKVEQFPNINRTITANFTGGQDVVYNADSNSYSIDSFTLIGTMENLWQLDDWDREDYSAHNVKMELTLPNGFSFEQNSNVQSKTYLFEEIIYTDNVTDTIYLSNPPVGISKLNIKITGDNVEEKNITYDFNVNKSVFQVDIYRANYLLNSDTGSTMENTYICSTTPCQELYKAGQQSGLGTATDAWSALMDTLNAIDKPSSIADYAFEEKDMYSAIIMSLFESSVDYELMEIIDNEVMQQSKNLVSAITSSMKNLYNFDVIDAEAVSKMTDKEKEIFETDLKDAYKSVHGGSAVTADVTKIISNGIKYGKDVETICETIETYKNIRDLTDSMKSVLKDMYDKCPSNDIALKSALLECIAVINSGETAFTVEMTAYTAGVVGKDIAQAGIDKLWGKIKYSFSVSHPAAFAFQAAYSAGKCITDVCFNSDAIEEKYCKVIAMINTEDLLKTVYYDIKSNFKTNPTEENAKLYNSVVDVMFNMVDIDCDYAVEFANSVDSSLAGKLSAALGDETIEHFTSQVKSIQTSTDLFHETVLTYWIGELELENINKFYEYEYLLNESWERMNKKYNINCPVDVYVFDKNGVIVGSVVNNVPYCRDDANITIGIVDDRKTIYMYSEEYDIVYKGNDAGTMDISVTEYDETNSATRNVYFNNLELTEGLTYTSSETGTNSTENVYTLSNESAESIAPDFDSVTDAETETYTVNISRGYFADTLAISQKVHSGENVDITAYVPEGYKFVNWTSDAECDIFDNANCITTKITMPDYDVNIAANLVSVPTLSISSITENSVTVKAKGCESISEGKIILTIYSESGALEQLETEDYTDEFTFTDLKLTKGKVKVMLWRNLNGLIPLTEATEKMFYFTATETE